MAAGMLELAMTSMMATMKASLPPTISALKESYADNVPMLDMKQYYDEARSEIPSYPALLIWYPEDASEFAAGQSSNNTASIKHNLVVEVACISDTEPMVRRMARRYGEALAMVLFQNQTLGAKVLSAIPRRMLRSPATPHGKPEAGQRKLVQSVAWEVEVRHFVDW